MVSVVIPAAGSGSRLGGTPKQLRQLGNVPVLYHTVRSFALHPEVSNIMVVGHPGELEFVRELLSPIDKLSGVVPGGETRQDSVQAGLQALDEASRIVLIHDAARPFVSEQLITNVIQSTKIYGAAAAALSVVDTMRYSEGDYFTKTISRQGLYAMQTPQGFMLDLLMDAFREAQGSVSVTDDVALFCRMGHRVRIVPGDPVNIKITTQSDWEWAQKMWNHIGEQ